MRPTLWRWFMAGLLVALCGCPPPSSGGTDSAAPDLGGDLGDLPVTDARLADLPSVDDTGGSAIKTSRLQVSGLQIVDGQKKPVALKCANLAGWLDATVYIHATGFTLGWSSSEFKAALEKVVGAADAKQFWSQYEDSFVTEKDFKRLAELGFNCVRVPLFYRNFAQNYAGTGPITLVEETMQRLDRAVTWGEKHGVWVFIDLHAAPGGQNGVASVSDVPSTDPVPRLWTGADAQKNQDWTVEIWRALATRYKGRTGVGGYDLLNEPALPLGVATDVLIALEERCLAAIRAIDPETIVIFEGPELAHDLTAFPVPTEPNLVYQFHAYTFTDANWKNDPGSNPKFAEHLAQRARLGRPLWLGEFGEWSRQWQAKMTGLMMKNDIGWAIWPWKRVVTFDVEIGPIPAQPVVQTIPRSTTPNIPFSYLDPKHWGSVVADLIANKPVDKPRAMQAMSWLLEWVKLENCTEDAALAQELVTGVPAT